jgi:predicted PurR-regulated permease PerM
VHPFVVMVSVLFGATLLGVVGALVAIPVAASIQIAINEWLALREERAAAASVLESPLVPPQPPPMPG